MKKIRGIFNKKRQRSVILLPCSNDYSHDSRSCCHENSYSGKCVLVQSKTSSLRYPMVRPTHSQIFKTPLNPLTTLYKTIQGPLRPSRALLRPPAPRFKNPIQLTVTFSSQFWIKPSRSPIRFKPHTTHLEVPQTIWKYFTVFETAPKALPVPSISLPALS